MKKILLPIVVVFIASLLPVRADLMDGIRINAVLMANSDSDPSAEVHSDATPDATTVRATLMNNPALKRWEFRFWQYLNNSPDLVPGLDLTLGAKIRANFFVYGLGQPQAPQSIYVHGANVSYARFVGDASISTFEVEFEPVMPVISASNPGGLTAVAGIDFPYSGVSQNPASVNYAPPIIAGNVLCSDIGAAQHASSMDLNGIAISVDGVNGQQADFDFIYSSKFAAAMGFNPDQAQAYLDGVMPAAQFGYTPPTAPSYTVESGDAAEEFRVVHVFNASFSLHDLQVGTFPQPLKFTGIGRVPAGIQLDWNADTNKTYTVEYFDALGEPPSTLATNLNGPGFLDTSAGVDKRYYRLVEEH